VRIVELDNGTAVSDTRFVWCALTICESRDSAGLNVLKRYFARGVQDNGTAYFNVRDHLQSVREMTDVAATVRARYDYDAWGRHTKVLGDQTSDLGYSGHFEHSASGLTFAPFRAYDSNVGRWMSEDPAGFGDGTNRFQYARNDSVGISDPTGLCGDSQPDGWWKGFMKGLTDEFREGGCAHVFFDSAWGALIPNAPSLSTASEFITTYSAGKNFQAYLTYVASRPNSLGGIGLIKPQGSIPAQQILGKVRTWQNPLAGLLLSVDLAIVQGLYTESVAYLSGECR
jgi:RHS repeat-associated protein